MKKCLLFLCCAAFCMSKNGMLAQTPIQTIFQAGENGYACYRIPAIVGAPDGKLLAFAEGRKNDCGDFGKVDIVLRTSLDGGETWGTQQIVATFGDLQCGNPAPVFDLLDPQFPQGRLFLFYNTGNASENDVRLGKGQRGVWFITSEDAGETWSAPTDITSQVHKLGQWRSYANTPGHALQLTNGRLFVPANHSEGAPLVAFHDYRAHAFFSDDHGKTFQLSPNVDYPSSNESTAAALPNNSLLMSIRNQSGDVRSRLLARSSNGGNTWDWVRFAKDLPDPVCQGSLLNIELKDGKHALLHANAAHPTERCCLSVKISEDEGLTWQLLHEIYPTSAAYSDLVKLADGQAALLFEADNYSRICYAQFRYY